MASETGLLFSVIIPTRHRNDLLALCLERLAPGVQSLSAERYEVFVTDDGSQTTAKAMIEERFPWASWVQGPCRGPGANRNNGVKHSTAPWLVFTDDDCIPSPGWLAAFENAILSDDTEQSGTGIYEGRTTCDAGLTSPLLHAPVNETGGWLWSCNMALRRDVFEMLGGFDDEFPYPHMEDVDLRERAWGLDLPTRFIPEAVIDHPPRPDNIGKKLAPMHESEFMMFYKAGFRVPFRLQHLRRVAGARVRKYMHFRTHPEAWQILKSLYIESLHILRHGGEWERKYRKRYEGTQVRYPDDLAKRLLYRV